ncbi:MAG: hypothetical protein M1839_004164 [Geoglossum umbratile]|nr:MAG: hypothetical protein M1839_004164 [Geoglossum umbratile]
MAAFDPIPYTYVPTAPRFKSTKAPYNRTPKQVSILDKIQCIKASGSAPGTPRPPAAVASANDSRNDRPGVRETSTIYGGNDKEEEDDDNDLPTIEDLLYTTLKMEGFATEDSSLDHRVRGVGEVAVEERGSFTNHNRSALGEYSGDRPDDPIVLLGDDDLGASEAEVPNNPNGFWFLWPNWIKCILLSVCGGFGKGQGCRWTIKVRDHKPTSL